MDVGSSLYKGQAGLVGGMTHQSREALRTERPHGRAAADLRTPGARGTERYSQDTLRGISKADLCLSGGKTPTWGRTAVTSLFGIVTANLQVVLAAGN